MSTVLVVGAQWGDEAKAKTNQALDELVPFDAGVRYSGGPNAGNTLYVGAEKVVLRQMPVTVVREGSLNFISPYVAVDPEVFAAEIAIPQKFKHTDGPSKTQVWLDGRSVLVTPLHRGIDGGREATGGIGTTKRGMGPAFEDFSSRRGVRLKHLRSRDAVAAVLKEGNYYGERCAVAKFHNAETLSLDDMVDWCMRHSDLIVPRLCDVVQEVRRLDAMGKRILLQGAQGSLLDIVHGTHPHVTSTFCTPGGAYAALGRTHVDHVLGVTKLYATRVGAGVFPTELGEEEAAHLRELGNELGAVTGRLRRTGWLDLPALKYACDFGLTGLVLTKVDVLNTYTQIKLCTGYRLDGQEVGFTPEIVERAAAGEVTLELQYVMFDGWRSDLASCRSFEKFPRPLRTMIRLIEDFTGIPIVGVSTGKHVHEMVWRPEFRDSVKYIHATNQ